MGGVGSPWRKMVIASNPDDSNDPIVTSGNCLLHFDFGQRDHLITLWNNSGLERFFLIHLCAFHAGRRSGSGKHIAWWDNPSLLPETQVLPSTQIFFKVIISSSKHSFVLPPKTVVVLPNPEDWRRWIHIKGETRPVWLLAFKHTNRLNESSR